MIGLNFFFFFFVWQVCNTGMTLKNVQRYMSHLTGPAHVMRAANQFVSHTQNNWVRGANEKDGIGGSVARIHNQDRLLVCFGADECTRPHRWLVNIGSGNALVPLGSKPLPKPMLTLIYVAIWCHSATGSWCVLFSLQFIAKYDEPVSSDNGLDCWVSIYNGSYSNYRASLILTHWGPVTHICVSKVIIIGSDNGLLPGRRQSHYLNQCWNIVNWTLRNKLQWNINGNQYIFIQENAFENVVCELTAILSRPQCVNPWHARSL